MATAVLAKAEVHSIVSSGEPFFCRFPEQMGASIVRMAVGAAAQSHPDADVRVSATEMVRSYEEHVFNDAMGSGPGEGASSG